ncbi:MAG: single-stranded-DNA-specific exonuclease RecJ [Deltaproteobacteria bacterium]|nr:single-stranded-DNA-specific exonuclease RecJ [Deltaproteobacteria bacterium]
MEKRYHISEPDKQTVTTLIKDLKCHPVIAVILVNRNIHTPEAAEAFLAGSLSNLRPPFKMKGMDAAVRRIQKALIENEKILIFGDYDVDGVTATALLYQFLSGLGARVSYYIPHRTKEGYGLRAGHIHKIAVTGKSNLIITVDCGADSHEAVQTAAEAGIDVIITDHHLLPDTAPPAVAVINPKQADCPAGFDMLAGVGVAYALLISLRSHLRAEGFWKSTPEPNLKDLSDLVALGTVADVVPLRDDNRILAKTGLTVIDGTNRPGLVALCETAGLKDKKPTAEDIAFRLAPRINAAGRMAHATAAVKLLITSDMTQARRIANMLNRLNTRRQSVEQQMTNQILTYIQSNPTILQKNSLVLKHPQWHEGILGIVASKLADRFYRPVVLISLRNKIGKGSARSIPGYHLYNGLKQTRHHLVSFGGHAMAAGLQIEPDRIASFWKEFDACVTRDTTAQDFLPPVNIDHMLSLNDITPELVTALESLQPFGEQNPEPLFMARNVEVVFSRIVAERHRQARLKQANANSTNVFDSIAFNIDPVEPLPPRLDRVAFHLRWNRWNGKKTIQLMLI